MGQPIEKCRGRKDGERCQRRLLTSLSPAANKDFLRNWQPLMGISEIGKGRRLKGELDRSTGKCPFLLLT